MYINDGFSGEKVRNRNGHTKYVMLSLHISNILILTIIIIFYLPQTRIDRMTQNLHSVRVVLFHPSYTIHWYSAKNVLKARCPPDKMKDRSSAASVPSSVHYRTRHLLYRGRFVGAE